MIIASLYNAFSGRGIPWFPQQVEVKTSTGVVRPQLVVTAVPVKYIEVTEARTKFEQGTLFVDAREADEYTAGHVQGARNISAKADDDQIQTALRGVANDQEIVVYCDGEECGASTTLANKLQGLGFTNVQIFFDGWTQWNKARLPISKG